MQLLKLPLRGQGHPLLSGCLPACLPAGMCRKHRAAPDMIYGAEGFYKLRQAQRILGVGETPQLLKMSANPGLPMGSQ